MFYSYFWVISQRQSFICRRFGKLCPFHLQRRCKHSTALEDGTECSESSEYKTLTPENYLKVYLSIYSVFFNSCRRLPESKCHSSLFLPSSGYKFLAAYTPSIHVFLGRPLLFLSHGIHSIINFDIISSGILFTWPYPKVRIQLLDRHHCVLQLIDWQFSLKLSVLFLRCLGLTHAEAVSTHVG